MKFLELSIKNNFTKHYFNTLDNWVYFKTEKKKKIFCLKTFKGKKITTKLLSIRRNKNITLDNQLINCFVKKGKKLNFLKHYNIFLENFFYLLTTNKQFYENFLNSDYILNSLKTKFYYYKFSNLLVDPIEDLKCIFDLKVKKVEKKKKKKKNKKYIYKILNILKCATWVQCTNSTTSTGVPIIFPMGEEGFRVVESLMWKKHNFDRHILVCWKRGLTPMVAIDHYWYYCERTHCKCPSMGMVMVPLVLAEEKT